MLRFIDFILKARKQRAVFFYDIHFYFVYGIPNLKVLKFNYITYH